VAAEHSWEDRHDELYRVCRRTVRNKLSRRLGRWTCDRRADRGGGVLHQPAVAGEALLAIVLAALALRSVAAGAARTRAYLALGIGIAYLVLLAAVLIRYHELILTFLSALFSAAH
jgi:hypothetical protein